jgi:heme/copper-type cytochrome/quinol oxidase subunit 3
MSDIKSEVYVDWENRRKEASRTALYLLFASIVMFFAALTSVLIIRSGTSDDFHGVPIPRVLWFSTGCDSRVQLFFCERREPQGDRVRAAVFWWASRSPGFSSSACADRAVGFSGPSASRMPATCSGDSPAFKWARFELARLYWHFVTGLWIYVVVCF